MPTVSIFIPCYNGGRFLDRLLASLTTQTFRDFEIIIVNDGSTDLLTKEKLAALAPEIRVIHQENRGLSAARNTGFRAAKADFVLPLDCDDTIEPQHLAETVARLNVAPPDVGFVFTWERRVGEDTSVFKPYFNRFDQLFANRSSYCMLFRKDAWRTVGGYDETMRDGYEDWEFHIRLTKAGFRGVEVKKALFVYRVSSDGMLMNHTSRMHGVLWRRMREKHRELYRVPALIRLWREEPGRLSLPSALAILVAATALPSAWYSAIFHCVKSCRIMLRKRRAAKNTLVTAE